MGCRDERFTLLTPAEFKNSLARKLIPVVDGIRDLRTQFGLRPYQVRLIRTQWTGGKRGLGQELTVIDLPILPTPLISDLTGVALTVTPSALEELGTIVLSEISGAYSDDMLLGKDDQGNGPGPDEDVWYEVALLGPTGEIAARRRFVWRSLPAYQAAQFQWLITLERAYDDRTRAGDVR